LTLPPVRAIFFDAGNTLLYPRTDELARDLTEQGYSADAEDFYAAERGGKQKLDEWLWPQIRAGQVPRQVDGYYWNEYLRVLMERIGAAEEHRLRLMRHVGERFRDIQTWSRVYPETAPFLDSLRVQGYYLGVISNSVGTIEEQLRRVDLARRFDTILDSAIVGVEKRDTLSFRFRDPYLRAKLGVAGSPVRHDRLPLTLSPDRSSHGALLLVLLLLLFGAPVQLCWFAAARKF